MSHINKARHITWSVARRGKGWVGIVFNGEDPITLGPPTTKENAKLSARQLAAEYRLNFGQ